MKPLHTLFRLVFLAVAAATVVACSTPAPPPAPTPKPPAAVPPLTAPAPAPRAIPAPAPTFVTETAWKRALAEHIQRVNQHRVFPGRPPYPLKGVVVVELTVAADGRVQRASVLRAPSHARELGAEAVRSAEAASPFPPPPRALAATGSVRLTETWLFRQDNLFQLRSVALEQIIQ